MKVFALQSPKKGIVLLGVFLAGLLWLTIFQVNALTALVYAIGDQEQRVAQVKEQGILLEERRVPGISREHMESLAHAMQFERVQEISYLKVLSATVAANTQEE